MKTIILYEFIKYKKNVPVLVLILFVTILLSVLEGISEISILVLVFIVPGIYGENKVDVKKTNLFETLMPISADNQVRGKYIVLLLKVFLANILYMFIYLAINKKMDITLIEQLFLLSSMSISMGVVIILKNMVGSRFKTPIYYLTLSIPCSLLFMVDRVDKILLPFELPIYAVAIVILILISYIITVTTARKLRGKVYDRDNV